jgi:hypothetical protein
MRSYPKCSSPSAPPPSGPISVNPVVFTAEFLARLREQEGPVTAAESEYAGPWKTAPVPGRPGRVGVVRMWESLEKGDAHRGVFKQEEVARLWAAALPLAGREPLFHLKDEAVEPGQGGVGETGYPVVAVEGENGPLVCGWLPLYEPEVVGVLHVLQGLVRSPLALAAVLEAAGCEALEQVDRILGRRLEV